ncbi:MAG: hypothetical protein DWQ54_22205 [Microcystis flos-aquae TF09]|uniref:Uncharacterized protein n=1 Tax=Microcystis flos-aquae TF09 TaxID=2060473 RepID=A0A3E0KWY0_9CHRO|nr:MAG: hypothetical protein DWQ54_22205 [Microcystis flos-aquae TF09]
MLENELGRARYLLLLMIVGTWQILKQAKLEIWLFWFLCGNEVYTDSFFDKIVLKVLPDKHFTIP